MTLCLVGEHWSLALSDTDCCGSNLRFWPAATATVAGAAGDAAEPAAAAAAGAAAGLGRGRGRSTSRRSGSLASRSNARSQRAHELLFARFHRRLNLHHKECTFH